MTKSSLFCDQGQTSADEDGVESADGRVVSLEGVTEMFVVVAMFWGA